MRIGNSRYWLNFLHYPDDNRSPIHPFYYLVLYRPIYPRAIILLIPLVIIPDREVKHERSFARVYAIHHFVALLISPGLRLVLGLCSQRSQDRWGTRSYIVPTHETSYKGSGKTTLPPNSNITFSHAERGQQNVGRRFGRESPAFHRGRQ